MITSRSAKVLVLSSGQALAALVGIVSMAVLTRVFSKLDFATYRQAILAYSFAVPFAVLGLDRALYFFLPAEQKRPRTVLVENLVLLTISGLILSLFMLLGGNHLLARRFSNPNLAMMLLLLAPYPLFMLPASSLGACLMASDRTKQVAAFNVGSRLMMLVCVLIPVLVWTRPAAAIVGTVVSSALTAMAALVLMFRACSVGPWRPTAAGMVRQLRFAVPLGLASLASSTVMSLDQLLVSMRCAPEVFAVYSVGAMEIPLIGIVTGSITIVAMVDYTKFYREGRVSEIVELIHRVMARSSMLLMPAMFLLLCTSSDLMVVLFGRRYEASAAVFRVYLLLLPMRTLSYGALLQATGRSRHILFEAVLELVANAAVGWVLIGILGSIGAAIAAVGVGYLTFIPYCLWVLHRTLRCSIRQLFPWQKLLEVTAASAVGVTVVIPMNYLSAMWPSAIRLTVGVLVYAAVTLAVFSRAGYLALLNPLDHFRALIGVAPSRTEEGTAPIPQTFLRPPDA